MLKRIDQWSEAAPQLDGLANAILDDLAPLLSLPGHAPHTVSREFSCYVDHLGALYAGTSNVDCGPDNLAPVGLRFKKYLREILKGVDSHYSKYADVIYKMYRNGPVHNFEPKRLRNKKGQTITWLEYYGTRRFTVLLEGKDTSVRHLQPVASPDVPNKYYLPVSTNCLLQDLLSSIDLYKDGLEKPDELATKWNEAVAVLDAPEIVEWRP